MPPRASSRALGWFGRSRAPFTWPQNGRTFAEAKHPSVAKELSRFDRINSRIPRFLRRYTDGLRNAPVTHISAFLILHELTAIVPLFGLVGLFHYSNWMPPFISEGKWVSDGIEKFGNYFRRKGWLGPEEDGKMTHWRGRWWGRGEGGARIVVEFATSYAIVKALLPLRLILSVWGTPWFARIAISPLGKGFGRLFRRKPKAASSTTASTAAPAAGTGATSGGVVPQKKP